MYSKFRWTTVSKKRVLILKAYEPIQPYFLLELADIVRADTFIDVGANVGVYSIFMSSLDCMKIVYSFEPSRETFAELERNVGLNAADGSRKINLSRDALSDVPGAATFGIVDTYSGANSIVRGSIHRADRFAREEVVNCVTLDSMGVEPAGTMCIKIDVEGHEDNVLKGGASLLRRKSTIIQIEHYREDETQQAMLLEWGYRKLISIGPDFYYTNIDALSCEQVLSALEKAAQALIATNLEADASEERPIRLGFSSGIHLELSGKGASLARRIKRFGSRAAVISG